MLREIFHRVSSTHCWFLMILVDMTFKFSLFHILPFSGASASSNSVSSSARAVGSMKITKFIVFMKRYPSIIINCKNEQFYHKYRWIIMHGVNTWKQETKHKIISNTLALFQQMHAVETSHRRSHMRCEVQQPSIFSFSTHLQYINKC